MHGLLPGPRLFEQSAQVIDSIYVGSFIAIIAQIGVGILILPACIWLVNRPRPYRAGFIFALILSGIYTLNNTPVRSRHRAWPGPGRLPDAACPASRSCR